MTCLKTWRRSEIHFSGSVNGQSISGPWKQQIAPLKDSTITDSTLPMVTKFGINRFCSTSSIHRSELGLFFCFFYSLQHDTSENHEQKKQGNSLKREKCKDLPLAAVSFYFAPTFRIHKPCSYERVETQVSRIVVCKEIKLLNT